MMHSSFARWSVSRGKRGMSRRRFLQAAAGTLGALGTGLLCPTPVLAAGREPRPIPAGFNFPGPADQMSDGTPAHPGNDPSSITDFDGYIGVAAMQGTGTGTDTDTGDMTPLLFDSDLRFMQGTYRSLDGRFIEANLVLVWLDLYKGQYDFTNYTTQTHDFDLSFSYTGVVWTTRLPDDNVLLVNFDAGDATLIADIDMLDYGTLPNAVALGAAVPAAVNYELRWRGPISRDITVSDSANSFRGRFLENTATVSWSASRAGFKFVSDAANTSKAVFAQLGRESNGVFF